jgi:hypothetical protein
MFSSGSRLIAWKAGCGLLAKCCKPDKARRTYHDGLFSYGYKPKSSKMIPKLALSVMEDKGCQIAYKVQEL